MNSLDIIKMHIKNNIRDCEVFIHDETDGHKNHYNQDSQVLPSHLYIKVISDSFNGMNLVSRHRKINDLMKDFFNQGLHALKIVTKTNHEVENE